MQKKIVVVSIVLLMTIPLILSDTADLSVTVGNLGPTFDNILIDAQDSSATVAPIAGKTKNIVIAAEVSDDNGPGDIAGVLCNISTNASIGGNFTSGAANRSGNVSKGTLISLYPSQTIDSNTGKFSGNLTLHFYDLPGTYLVQCIAADKTNLEAAREERFTYQPLTALDLDAATIAFGSLNPGQTSNVTGDNNMSTETRPTIRNVGNTVIDAAISGLDLVNKYNDTIAVENVRYRFSDKSLKTLGAKAITENRLKLGVGSLVTTNVNFHLTIPTGTPETGYAGAVTISAVTG